MSIVLVVFVAMIPGAHEMFKNISIMTRCCANGFKHCSNVESIRVSYVYRLSYVYFAKTVFGFFHISQELICVKYFPSPYVRRYDPTTVSYNHISQTYVY